VQEALAVTRKSVRNARNLRDVDSGADDHEG
jgi:hypothetical protein